MNLQDYNVYCTTSCNCCRESRELPVVECGRQDWTVVLFLLASFLRVRYTFSGFGDLLTNGSSWSK